MPTIKLTALAAATTLACLPTTPAAAAGPLFAPWAVGHLLGAAARLAALPIIAASAAGPAGQPLPRYYAAPGYNTAPPAYFPPAGYYAPPAYYRPPAYHAASGPAYFPSRYSPAPAYGRFPESWRSYSVSGMRYSGSYGGQVFGRARGFTYRRW